jgi:hypothetical protein
MVRPASGRNEAGSEGCCQEAGAACGGRNGNTNPAHIRKTRSLLWCSRPCCCEKKRSKVSCATSALKEDHLQDQGCDCGDHKRYQDIYDPDPDRDPPVALLEFPALP